LIIFKGCIKKGLVVDSYGAFKRHNIEHLKYMLYNWLYNHVYSRNYPFGYSLGKVKDWLIPSNLFTLESYLQYLAVIDPPDFCTASQLEAFLLVVECHIIHNRAEIAAQCRFYTVSLMKMRWLNGTGTPVFV
jgi:hypothetical protein